MATSSAMGGFPLEEEYKKPTGITPQDIDKLREWLHTQPHLPADYITDLDLILAYHCCGRSAEVSKQLLDTHYTARTMFTNFFKDRVVDAKIESLCQKFLVTPLPTRTKEGYAVIYMQFVNKDPQDFVLADAQRFLIMVMDLWQYEEGTWPGFVMVANLAGMAFGHLSKFDLPTFQQFTYYLQDALLLNLKATHVINAPGFYDTMLGLVRPIVRSGMLDRLHVHQVGATTLEQFYPAAALPREAGGTYKPVAELQAEVLTNLRAHAEYFAAENKKRVAESLRPGQPKTISDIFGGVEGSFKQLEVD